MLEGGQYLAEILQFLPVLEHKHRFWALFSLARSTYHHTRSLLKHSHPSPHIAKDLTQALIISYHRSALIFFSLRPKTAVLPCLYPLDNFLSFTSDCALPFLIALLSTPFSGHIKPKLLGLYFQGASQLISALPIIFHLVSRDQLSPSISSSTRWKQPQILPPPSTIQQTNVKQQFLPSVPETLADGTTLSITG